MELGEAGEGKQLKAGDVATVAVQQLFPNVAPALVPRAQRRTRAPAGDDLEDRKGRLAGEILVGIDSHVRRMVHRQQPNLIEIDQLLHRFKQTEAQPALARLHTRALHLDVLVRVGNVAFAGSHPMAHHRRSDDVAHQLVAASIPNEQNRAGTSAAVNFIDGMALARGQLQLVLQNSRRPAQPQDVGCRRGAEPGGHFHRALPQVARGRLHFPLLPESAGEDFHFGPNGALVVGQTFQRHAQPGVAVSALIAQQAHRAAVLRHQQVGVAVAIVVGGDQRPWTLELHLSQRHLRGYILKTFRPQVAQQANLRFLARLTHCNQVQPTVVVIVKRGHAPAAHPTHRRQSYHVKPPALDVAPQTQSRLAPMSEGQVHPAVLIEVKDRHADCGRRHGRRPEFKRRKFPLARVGKDGGSIPQAGQQQVNRAIVVEVGTDSGHARGRAGQSGRLRPIGEGTVAVVAPQHVAGRNNIHRKFKRLAAAGPRKVDEACYVEVEVAVVVVVQKSQTQRQPIGANADLGRNINKGAVSLIAKQRHTAQEADRQVGPTIVVVVGGRAAHPGADRIQARLARDLDKAAPAAIPVERAGSVLAAVDQKQISAPVTVVVQEASARTKKGSCGFFRRMARGSFAFGGKRAAVPEAQPGLLGRGHETHPDRRRHCLRCTSDLLSPGVLALLAVDQTHGRAQVLLRQVLEARQVLSSLRRVSQALIGARQPELGGDVKGVQRQGGLEGGDGRLIPLKLRAQQPQEVLGVSILRVKLCHPLESFQRHLGLAQVLVQQAQVVPDPHVSRFLLAYRKQGGARGVVALQIQQGNALVEPGGVEFGIHLVGLLELLQRLCKALLVHIGHAQVVEPDGFLNRPGFRHAGRGNESQPQNRQGRIPPPEKTH